MRIQDIPIMPTCGSQIGYIRPCGRSKTVRVASRGAAPFGLPPSIKACLYAKGKALRLFSLREIYHLRGKNETGRRLDRRINTFVKY